MWVWSQAKGTIDRGNGTGPLYWGYAGHGGGVNNPDLQSLENVGPLPQGLYVIGPPHDAASTGPYTLNLEPDPANVMFGRSAFRIHGDNALGNRTASSGCIILPRMARQAIWASGDRDLTVTP